MKFAVGIMLTSFGIFWGAEGAGAHWPGADVAVVALVPTVALFALALVVVLRGMTRGPQLSSPSANRQKAS